MNYELLFLKCLALTIFIETFVLIAYIRLVAKLKNITVSKLLLVGFFASFATLPYLWFVFPIFIDNKLLYIIIAESFAVLMETIFFSAMLRTKYTHSFFCSLTCNMISFLAGLIIF